MHTPLPALLLVAALLAVPVRAQEPDEPPQEPPAEEPAPVPATEPSEPPEERDEEAEDTELTPKQVKAREEAAKRTAKRDERRAKREEKLAREEEKQLQKRAQEALERGERVAELLALGDQALEAGEHEKSRGRFEKAKELQRDRSFPAQMGLARVSLALGEYAQATQLAQRAMTMTADPVERAVALTFAGDATLAAVPRADDGSGAPLPGYEIFQDAALRYYIRAFEEAPDAAAEARAHLDRRFPPPAPGVQEERLLARYLEQDPVRADAHRLRVGAAYRALLGDPVEPGQPVAVVGPITPPVRLTGGPVPVTPRAGRPGRPRLGVAFVVEADGSVSAVELLARVPDEPAALAVLEQWHFQPARLPDGRAVPVHWVQSVRVRSE